MCTSVSTFPLFIQTQSYLVRAYLNYFILTNYICSDSQNQVTFSGAGFDFIHIFEGDHSTHNSDFLCYVNFASIKKKKTQTTKQPSRSFWLFSSKRRKPWTRSDPGLPLLSAFLLFSYSLLSPADLVPVPTTYFYFFPHPLPLNSSEAFYPLGPSSKVTFMESACLTSWCKTASFIIYATFDLVIYCCVAKHWKTSWC